MCWQLTSTLKRTKRLISSTLSLLKLPLPPRPPSTPAFQVTITENNGPSPVLNPQMHLKALPLPYLGSPAPHYLWGTFQCICWGENIHSRQVLWPLITLILHILTSCKPTTTSLKIRTV